MDSPEKNRGIIIDNPLREILLVVLCILAIEWIILPFTKNPFIIAVPVIISLVVIIYSHIKNKETPKVIGWHFEGFFETLKLLAIPMIVLSGILVFVGWLSGSLRFQETLQLSFSRKILEVFIGAVFQQQLMQAFINRRAEAFWGKGAVSVLVTASIFALFHLPNFWLTVFTFVAGVLWFAIYQRSKNLFALSLSHLILSLVVIYSISRDALHGMRVGFNYFGY